MTQCPIIFHKSPFITDNIFGNFFVWTLVCMIKTYILFFLLFPLVLLACKRKLFLLSFSLYESDGSLVEQFLVSERRNEIQIDSLESLMFQVQSVLSVDYKPLPCPKGTEVAGYSRTSEHPVCREWRGCRNCENGDQLLFLFHFHYMTRVYVRIFELQLILYYFLQLKSDPIHNKRETCDL